VIEMTKEQLGWINFCICEKLIDYRSAVVRIELYGDGSPDDLVDMKERIASLEGTLDAVNALTLFEELT
jgi:hypothetical protein